MHGSGALPLSRTHGTDRFYNPPAVRRQLQLQQRRRRLSSKPKAPAAVLESRDSENHTESDDSSSSKPSVCSSPSSPLPPPGNLYRFIEAMTPTVPAQYLFKTSMRAWAWRKCDPELQNLYYDLGDLWESFKEWSAYGAGVRLVLNGSDFVIQYHVPYLSAIQLYTYSRNFPSTSRRPGEESDGGESCRETSSEESINGDANCPKQDGMRSNRRRLIFGYFE